jgi:hypothetical protein
VVGQPAFIGAFGKPEEALTNFMAAGKRQRRPNHLGAITPIALPSGLDSPAVPQNATMEQLASLTDDDLAMNIDAMRDHVAVEFSRRLVTSNKDLIEAIRTLRSASDEASRTLLRATWVLVGLTVVIAGLTAVLVIAN